jgi:hypothetical protein
MRTNIKMAIGLVLVLICWFLFGDKLHGQQMTPEQVQEKVVERAREIEKQEAEAKAQLELQRKDTPAMRKARRQLQREANVEKRSRGRSVRAMANANVVSSCESGGIVINPQVGHDKGLKESYLYDTESVMFMNMSDGPVRIVSTLHGTLIQGLCPGASATISFSPTPNGPTSVRFTLVATSETPGDVSTDEFKVSLRRPRRSSHDNRRTNGKLWKIQTR